MERLKCRNCGATVRFKDRVVEAQSMNEGLFQSQASSENYVDGIVSRVVAENAGALEGTKVYHRDDHFVIVLGEKVVAEGSYDFVEDCREATVDAFRDWVCKQLAG